MFLFLRQALLFLSFIIGKKSDVKSNPFPFFFIVRYSGPPLHVRTSVRTVGSLFL